MRFLVQRVKRAEVKVDGRSVGKIDAGLLVFVGVSADDTEEIADKMTDKLIKLRIFEDNEGKTNLSIGDVKGEFLVISQFTLYADMRRGNRPSFTNAGAPDMANSIYEHILQRISDSGFEPQHGIFGADMKVELLNDGPFTVIMDSDEIIK